jgi:biopolymer transport protein ExbD
MARYTGYIISELDSLARLLDIPGLIVAGSRVQVALDKASQKEEQGEPYYLLWTVTEERVERWKQTPIDYDDLLTALSAKEIKRAKNGDRYHIYLKTSIKPKYLYGGLEILTKENVKNLNLLEDF